MYIDWITWGIWLIGFMIMIIWIYVPVREFKRLVKKKMTEQKNLKNSNSQNETR